MLPHPHRITEGREFAAVVRRGARRGSESIVVHARATEPDAPARFGFVVSKAVGGAVRRNVVKRRLRACAANRIRAGLRGVDVVVRALPAALAADFAELDRQLASNISRAVGAGAR